MFVFFWPSLLIFSDARLSPLIISGPVVLTKSIIFSGNSILFLDFSYLLSIFFLRGDAFASPAPFVFSDSHTKTIETPLRFPDFAIEVCCIKIVTFTANWLKAIKMKCFWWTVSSRKSFNKLI